MSYVIKYALSYKDCDIVLDLCKNGNKYNVTLWNRARCRTIRKFTCDRFSLADHVFPKWYSEYDMMIVYEAAS